MDTLKNVVFIYEQRPFALALQRALRDTAEVQLFPKEKKWNLDSANTTHSTVIILDTDYEEGMSEEAEEIREWLWVIIRGRLELLSPFVCLGFEDTESFMDDPWNLFFNERSPEYKYLRKPFLLKDLINVLRDIQPLPDDGNRKWHIQRFAYKNGLTGYLHKLKGAILANNLTESKRYIESVNCLLPDLTSTTDLRTLIGNFLQGPNLELARSISEAIERCLYEENTGYR